MMDVELSVAATHGAGVPVIAKCVMPFLSPVRGLVVCRRYSVGRHR